MKRLLVTGVAVLFLATGTAHAYHAEYYDCGKAFVKIETASGSTPRGRVFPRTWTILENWEREDAKNLDPIDTLNLKCVPDEGPGSRNDRCRLNGKFCRRMSDEEGKKEFHDED
jgi:hypothetical protein